MLAQEVIKTVKATAPILQNNGEILTQHFYKRMFTHNPEVLPYFNQANQSGGTQQKALAGAIAAYAANIDNLEALGDAVELIANKHASLQIKPEHYPIVGENLLASIKEVLGDAATEEIVEAWAQAYGFLADILIGREKEIYENNALKEGGWEGFRKFKIIKKEQESSVITSIYLEPEDGQAVPLHSPGQYISLRIPTPDGSTTMRNYSLSDKPGKKYFRISVKRETGCGKKTPDGYVSNKLHKEYKIGDVLEVGPPCGDFYLNVNDNQERPLVLLAAGVGITPILSMLLSALEKNPKREIIFVQACLDEKTQAFKSTIDSLAEKYSNLSVYYRFSEAVSSGIKRENNASTGFVTAEFLDTVIPQRSADYYFCGPNPFMVNVYQNLLQWNIPASQMHFEFFGPREELESLAHEDKAA